MSRRATAEGLVRSGPKWPRLAPKSKEVRRGCPKMSQNVALEKDVKRLPPRNAPDYVWAAGFVGWGALIVGATFGLIWYAIPERGIAKQWYIFGAVLLVPYILLAFGSWLSSAGHTLRSSIRVTGIVVCLMGIAIFLVSLEDLSPVLSGD